MPCISNTLIVGGGIAGLSAALALAQVGVRCDVVELYDSPMGASLGLSGRVANALDELGVYDACFATSTPFYPDSKLAWQYDATGRLITEGPKRPEWPGSKVGVGVYRPVFLQILTDAAKKLGVKVQKGITAEKIEDRAANALVTFSDGTQQSYDLVIGADGIGSKTRSLIFPDAPKPAYSGQISIRWMAPGPMIDGAGWYNGPVGKIAFYGLPQGMIYVPAVISMPEQKRMRNEEVYVLFTRLLDSFTAPAIVELRKRLKPDANLICRPFEWILVPPPWYRGKTLLIGDAAHATTAHMGMGGGMAVEDSVVLAQCVDRALTLAEALENFMSRRLSRVTTVVENSVALSKLEQEGAPPSQNIALLTSAFHALSQPY